MTMVRPVGEAGTSYDSLPDGFAAAVRSHPGSVAVRCGGVALTYRELDGAADSLAERIRPALPAGERRVAVLLERSIDLVVSIIAALKAGACYIPLAPANPIDRTRLILADAVPDLVITSRPYADQLPAGTPTLCLDDGAGPGTPRDEPAGPPVADRNACAYVIYTSGTTGRPKGARISHANVLHLFAATQPFFRFGGDDVWSMYHSIAFDFSVWEMWGALLHGGCVVVVPDAVAKDPAEFRALLRAEGVTMLSQTPTAFGQLVAEESKHSDRLSVRHVVFGGEPLRFADLGPWIAKYGDETPELTNMYGITETTVHASYRRVRQADLGERASLIGVPLPGYDFRLVDRDLADVEPGRPGEIVVTGAGVCLGYLNRPELTRERFIELPGSDGTPVRGYRTGDLARSRPDGDLEFAGRNDDQVKIRGFRVELGEVEAALIGHSAVLAGAVAIRELRSGERALVGYVVPAGTTPLDDPDGRRLRADLARVLPDYMVPVAITFLESLPMTPNGKLDRAALPGLEQLAGTVSGPARSVREELLCDLFAQALGRTAVGPDDDFFALGGHSLTAVRLINRIRTVLGLEVGIQELFEACTPRALAQRGHAPVSRLPLTPRDRGAESTLSYAQQRLWFMHQIYGATPANHLPYALHVTGRLDVAALDAALRDVVTRHEVLRTVYPERDGFPIQRILPPDDLPSPLTVTRVATGEADDLVRDAARAGYDLTADLPLRATLFVTGPERSVLLLVLHHIAADGWSLEPLMEDLATAYTARLAGGPPAWPPLPIQYADYALWQQELVGDDSDPDSITGRQLAYWTEHLRGAPDELTLPTDRSRPHAPSFQGGLIRLNLDRDLHTRLIALGRTAGTTITMVLQAAVASLLTRLGAGTDLPIAVPTAGRVDDALHPLVGFFVNTLVTRLDTSGDPTFAELLRRVRATSLAAYDNQDLPFERLVEVLNPLRSSSRHPLAQVVVGTQPGVPPGFTLPGLTLRAQPVSNLTVKFDLAFRFEERRGPDGQPQGAIGTLEYSTDLFNPENADLIAERFRRLLRCVPERPDLPLSKVDLVGDAERRLLDRWNDTDRPLYEASTAGVLVERQVDRTPGAIAVVQEDTRWTYQELDERANQIAHLLRDLGTGSESMVALCLSRGPWFIAAMLGVWKAGASYTPLEIRDPAERLAFMMRDSGARVVLTDGDTCDGVALPPGAALVHLDRDSRLATAPISRPPNAYGDTSVPSRRVAYAVYTSGSTGQPKCVLVEHRGVLSRLGDVIDQFQLREGDINLQLISLGVEVPVREFLAPLVVGGTVAMVPPLGERDPGIVVEAIRRTRPTTIICMVHSLLQLLLSYDADARDFASVRTVGTGGEVLHAVEAEEIMNAWGCDLVNQYGPTETTMMCTQYRVGPSDLVGGGRIPIGPPLSNTKAYVLDNRLAPVPIGVTGEVYISGLCVARGFLNRPGITAERYVADPFGPPGTRMYRSGDLARWRADGNLVFVGRVDGQVRIRGFRVEIGEIEAELLAHPHVGRAVVTVHEAGPGDQRLAAYLLPAIPDDPDGRPTPTELRDHLTQRLPDQMIPTTFTVLDAFPLLPNGKVHRALLPEPDLTGELTVRGPRTPHEEVLCALFAEVLSVPRVGIDNDFFQLGGHSLLAARLMGRVRATLGFDLALRTLFETPTVAGLARRLSEDSGAPLDDGTAALEMMLPLRSRGTRPPLFCIHPGGGLSWGYARLLRHLHPETPIYGVQAHGLLHPDDMPDTIEDMAASYIEQLRAVQPEGPYHLLGWSLGGIVAYEMAVQLQARGADIELLALLDSYPGVPDHFRVGDRTMLRSLIDPDRANAVPEQGSIEFTTAMDIIRQDTGALASLTETQVEAMLRTMAHNRRIVRPYEPRFFDGDLLFFLAAEARIEGAPTAEVWTAHVSGTVTSHSVDATHIDMFAIEPAAQIGRVLADELNRLFAGSRRVGHRLG